MYDNSTLLSTRFPQKLWKIVNECKTSAISWNTNGTSILLDYKKFHEQYLSPGNKIFKTSNITSFIRQLNLYGFRKVTSHNRDPMCNMKNPDIHEFTHDYFNRDCENLLTKVCRKASRKSKKIHQQHNNYYRHHQHQHQHDQGIKYFDAPTKDMKVYQQGLTRLQMCQVKKFHGYSANLFICKFIDNIQLTFN